MIKPNWIRVTLTSSAILLTTFLFWSLTNGLVFLLTSSLLASALISLPVVALGLFIYRRSVLGQLHPPQALAEASNPFFWGSMLLGLITAFMLGQVLGARLYELFGSPSIDATNQLTASQPMWQMIVVSMVIGPLAEEMLIRGMAYNFFRTQMPAFESMIIATAIFAILHGSSVQAVTVVPMSFILCISFEVTKRVWVPWLIHGIFNAGSLLPVKIIQPFLDPASIFILLLFFLASLTVILPMIGKKELESIWPVKGQIQASKLVTNN